MCVDRGRGEDGLDDFVGRTEGGGALIGCIDRVGWGGWVEKGN